MVVEKKVLDEYIKERVPTIPAFLSVGFKRETILNMALTENEVELGLTEIPCIECGGMGIWPFRPDGEDNTPCVNCKGTGKIYINC